MPNPQEWFQVTLLFPLRDNDGNPFPEEVRSWWFDEMTKLVKGFTDRGVVRGWWRKRSELNREVFMIVKTRVRSMPYGRSCGEHAGSSSRMSCISNIISCTLRKSSDAQQHLALFRAALAVGSGDLNHEICQFEDEIQRRAGQFGRQREDVLREGSKTVSTECGLVLVRRFSL